MVIHLSEAIQLYMADKRSEGLSSNTLNDYRYTFRSFQAFLASDPAVIDITGDMVRNYFSTCCGGISNKTKLNRHAGLSSLWTWATEEREICEVHILRRLKRARAERPEIRPFTRCEVETIIGSLELAKNYSKPTGGQAKGRELDKLVAARNRAMVLFLLDTGVRASELCGLRVGDLYLGEYGVHLAAIGPAFAKFKRGRSVPLSPKTYELIKTYLELRGSSNPEDYLFLTDKGKKLKRDTLRQMLDQVRSRCGLEKLNAHRFRHTFAITFLRNGGDVFNLQAILGHSTLDMVKRYLAIAQTDIERSHSKASPVMNWEL